MRLIFPNGEHAQVVLDSGVTRIGAGPDCQIMLAAPGIGIRHAEIHIDEDKARLEIPNPDNVCTINGKQAKGRNEIRPGDLITFAKVSCRVTEIERAKDMPAPAPKRDQVGDDDGRTRVRMALPKFLLRGVSGTTFGKTFPLAGAVVVGRHSECDISIPSEEVSRRHAQLKVTADGVMVEDLGSANGTYINNKRVREGLLKPGDELRLDNLRFLLIAPGMEPAAAAKPVTPTAEAPQGGSKAPMIIGIVVVLAIAAAAGLYFGGVIKL